MHINLDFTKDPPSYQRATTEEGFEWLSRYEDWGGRELVYLDMRESKYINYKLKVEKDKRPRKRA